ncbi:unnamed protein product [Zymoseptoria tritici ST99CH_3D7]|uniref:protein-tyrosine-phosphatase n=1 Tax=Zymoseptoria tritici (strain ST99CH_3D7) TaxID=1276538 RepID=A0A1X7RTS1_ZYMT9|nr:unnamed protein product [Zymoseptoria tritici ST99CH_3D7]
MSPTEGQTKPLPHPSSEGSQTTLLPSSDYDHIYHKFHQHTLSDSTNTLGSNESSPTTTISTVDDSSATEPSPGSSPESPPPSTFAVGMLRPRTEDARSAPFFELQKQPPPRKGRNLKNLAVVTSRLNTRASSTTSLPLRAAMEDSSLSPAFVKPPTPPRRKPSALGLTIMTPALGKPKPQEVRLLIPETPSFGRPTLRHFQSSPSLPLAPGLGLPPSRDAKQRRNLETIFSPLEAKAPEVEIQEEEEEEQNFDIPLSMEDKPEAYPDGPICVYDPRIDLYLEPTAEQARQYDVIMNVASEVRNPLVKHDVPPPVEPDLRLDGGGGIQYAPKRDRPVSRKDEASPTTPKATPPVTAFPAESQAKEPEYIHIPWEHNSDIVPDLLRLVKLIDERVMEGKRILIHCQCGVSRSASLVVAYGIYKNPDASVQEAYDAVKKRSKWIGPNMNLIMQLQEFRSSLARGGLLGDRTLSPRTPSSALSEWKGPFSDRATPMSGKSMTIPDANVNASNVHAAEEAPISPGPSSAPSGVPWQTGVPSRRRALSAVKPATAYVDPSGNVIVPVLKVLDINSPRIDTFPQPHSQSDPELPQLQSPTSTQFATPPSHSSIHSPTSESFNLQSPTRTSFPSSISINGDGDDDSHPFSRASLLASIGMASTRSTDEEETPRRNPSFRAPTAVGRVRSRSSLSPNTATTAPRRLAVKISSPNLSEQRQLQEMQGRIERELAVSRGSGGGKNDVKEEEEVLMSPRVGEFLANPFKLGLAIPTTSETERAESNGSSLSGLSGDDPRSPVGERMKGVNPFVRNIEDVL